MPSSEKKKHATPTYLWPPNTPWLTDEVKPTQLDERLSGGWQPASICVVLLLFCLGSSLAQLVYKKHIAADEAAFQRARADNFLMDLRMRNATDTARIMQQQLFQSQQMLDNKFKQLRVSVRHKLKNQNLSTEHSLTALRRELAGEKGAWSLESSRFSTINSKLDKLDADNVGRIVRLEAATKTLTEAMPKLGEEQAKNERLSKLLGRQKNQAQQTVKALQSQVQKMMESPDVQQLLDNDNTDSEQGQLPDDQMQDAEPSEMRPSSILPIEESFLQSRQFPSTIEQPRYNLKSSAHSDHQLFSSHSEQAPQQYSDQQLFSSNSEQAPQQHSDHKLFSSPSEQAPQQDQSEKEADDFLDQD